jgi:hypothetical protein
MYFFEYEMTLDEIKKIQEEQKKENDAQQEQYDSMQKNMNPSSMMRSAQANMPKMSMSSFSMPKI